jgi:uncharacterized protein (DUF4213/DUF364 family)
VPPKAHVVALNTSSLLNHTFDDSIGLCCLDARVALLGGSALRKTVLCTDRVGALTGTHVLDVPSA